MFSFSVLVLTLLVSAVQSSFSRRRDLTDLYNSRVYKAERMFRPMSSSSSGSGIFRHSGVRVTLEDGRQFLIHKGKDYGADYKTVVVDANHMSSRWKTQQTKDFEGTKTVADLVRAGGADYHLLQNNCHRASSCMMNPDKRSCN